MANTTQEIRFDKEKSEIILLPYGSQKKYRAIRFKNLGSLRNQIWSYFFTSFIIFAIFPILIVFLVPIFVVALYYLLSVKPPINNKWIHYRVLSTNEVDVYLNKKSQNNRSSNLATDLLWWEKNIENQHKRVEKSVYSKRKSEHTENMNPKEQVQKQVNNQDDSYRQLIEKGSTSKSKSIFDDYESVMDKFDKK